jgi:hypothetical protein
MDLKIGDFAKELNISTDELKNISRKLNLLRIVYSVDDNRL